MLWNYRIHLSPAATISYPAVIMQQYPGNSKGSSGWVTTRQAAAALRLQPRQIRNLITAGDLEAQTEGEGVNRRYLVSIASIEALRQKRQEEGKVPGQDRDVAEGAVMSGQSTSDAAELARELAAQVGEMRYELGRAEARLELTSQAESSVREALERERERADLERARADRLEAELLSMRREEASEAPEPPRGVPETAAGGTPVGKGDSPEPQDPVKRHSWLYRFFFGP
jgi:hypothetical protein